MKWTDQFHEAATISTMTTGLHKDVAITNDLSHLVMFRKKTYHSKVGSSVRPSIFPDGAACQSVGNWPLLFSVSTDSVSLCLCFFVVCVFLLPRWFPLVGVIGSYGSLGWSTILNCSFVEDSIWIVVHHRCDVCTSSKRLQ